jgi:hypothetical protein
MTRAVIVLVVLMVQGGIALAQDSTAGKRLPRFELPFGNPRQYAMGARLMEVTRSDNLVGDGAEADVFVGENVPLIALRRGDNPITIGFGGLITGRFSLSDLRNTFIASDWGAAVNVNAMLGHWNLVGEIGHESSHLGDEYIENFDVADANWSRDGLSGWVFYLTGPWRFGANVNWAWKDVAGRNPWGTAAGIDWFASRTRLLGLRVTPRAGVYLEMNDFADWKPMLSGKIGLAVPVAGGPDLTVSLMGLTGSSPQRQFYDEQTTYVGLELRIDL